MTSVTCFPVRMWTTCSRSEATEMWLHKLFLVFDNQSGLSHTGRIIEARHASRWWFWVFKDRKLSLIKHQLEMKTCVYNRGSAECHDAHKAYRQTLQVQREREREDGLRFKTGKRNERRQLAAAGDVPPLPLCFGPYRKSCWDRRGQMHIHKPSSLFPARSQACGTCQIKCQNKWKHNVGPDCLSPSHGAFCQSPFTF